LRWPAEQQVIAERDYEQFAPAQLFAEGEQRCGVAVSAGEVLGDGFHGVTFIAQLPDVGGHDRVAWPYDHVYVIGACG
jgi:hypothetical protein